MDYYEETKLSNLWLQLQQKENRSHQVNDFFGAIFLVAISETH